LTIKFKSGALGYHFGTWGARGTRLRYSFHAHGEEGMLEANFSTGELILHQNGKSEILSANATDKRFTTDPSSGGKQAEHQLQHFAKCVETGITPNTDGRRSLQSLRVIWRLYEAERRSIIADLTGLGLDQVEQPLQLRVDQAPITFSK